MTTSAAAASTTSTPTSTTTSSPPPPDVDSFLRDLTALERTTELTRILAAFRLNPFDILNVSHAATRDEVSKAYRSASLQVHPDKFTPGGGEREKAQQAFTLLTAAKDELLDEAKREALDTIIDQARQRVLTNKAAEGKQKKRKTVEGEDVKSTTVTETAEVDASLDPEFDLWIRNEVKEIIIEREWRKRQLLKAAAAEDVLAAAEKAKRAEEREAKANETKEWEEGRENRINSWRDFQKGKTKSGKAKIGMMKMPKAFKEDAENSFIRRPVTHQSSDK